MKKRIGLFLTILALALCMLAISVSAIEYSDFAQNGTNGEEPIFTFLGYSIDYSENSICVEYAINVDARNNYERASGKILKYGILAVDKAALGGKSPFDSKTGKPIDISATGKKMATFDQKNRDSARIYVRLTNVTEEYYKKELLLCLYTYDGSGVKYVTGDASTSEPDSVTYEEIRGPIDTTIDNVYFTTIKPESTIAYDRQKQMKQSEAEYGTPVVDANTYTSSKMSSVLKGAKTIAGEGFLGGIVAGVYPNASRFMANYLKNTGADMTIDMGTGSKGFLKSSSTKAHRVTRVNQALRAAETLAREGQSISVYQGTEQVNHFGDTEDWYLAVGSYFTCIEMHNVTVTVDANGTKTYSAQLKYTVTDFYNWNENSWSEIPIVNVSQRDLHQLHRTKQAKEFEAKGSVTYTITWTEGQDASGISF